MSIWTPDNPGWNFEVEHENDNFRRFVREHAIPVPRSFKTFEKPAEVLPQKWHEIENQANMGSCQGHDISNCLEHLWFVATGGEIKRFSRIFAYLGTQEIDGLIGSDNGSTISGGGKLLLNTGLPTEEDCPYPNPVRYPDANSRKRILSAQMKEKASHFRIRTVVTIKSYQDAYDWIGGGGALSLGIKWPVRLNSSHTVTQYSESGDGGHAIAGEGYKKNGDLIIANSHSVQYGDKGWLYVTPQAFEQMLRGRWTACIGLSDMKDPKPRRVDYRKVVGL